jgi:HAD superfamily hydrolase (TIGR01509 family)
MINAVIFDLDGTLIDTERFTLKSKMEAPKDLGYEGLSYENALKTFGLSIKESNELLRGLMGEDYPVEYIRQKRFDYVKEEVEKNGLCLKKGVNEIIKFCKENNIKIFIATASSNKYLDLYLKNGNLLQQFDDVITGSMVERGKPFPDIFLKAVENYNFLPCNCIVVEDANNGLRGALAGNFKAVYIKDICPLDEELRNFVTELDSLLDLPNYIKNVNKE